MNSDELDDIAAGMDTHDVVAAALAGQMEMLQRDPRHELFAEWNDDEISRAVADIATAQQQLADHSRIHGRVVDADVPTLCASCLRPRPCPVVLELRRVYS